MRNRLLAVLAAIAVLVGGVFTSAPTANAGLDPYWPIPVFDWCPGGQGGAIVFGIGAIYCEGVSYPDGTRWQDIRTSVSVQTQCIIFTGQPAPPLAPPWGCGRG